MCIMCMNYGNIHCIYNMYIQSIRIASTNQVINPNPQNYSSGKIWRTNFAVKTIAELSLHSFAAFENSLLDTCGATYRYAQNKDHALW